MAASERAAWVFLGACGGLAVLLIYRRRRPASVLENGGADVNLGGDVASLDAVADMCGRREERLAQWGSGVGKKHVPVALITGRLGAGKTTLLKHIMQEGSPSLNFGVVVNDFAELNIDAADVKSQRIVDDSVVYEMTNGCICCSIKGSFEKMIVQIGQHVDYLLIETSGVTNPLEMLAVLEKSIQDIQSLTLRLDCLVSVVDADVLDQNRHGLEEERHLFQHADVVLLNKISLLSDPDRFVAEVTRLCPPSTVIKPCEYCNVPLQSLLDVAPIEPEREGGKIQRGAKRSTLMRYKVNEWSDRMARELPTKVPAADNHLGAWRSLVFQSDEGPFALSSFQELISAPLWRENVVRLKGTAWFQHDPLSRFSMQMSGRERYEVIHEGQWKSSPKIQLVAIVQSGSSWILEQLDILLNTAVTPTGKPDCFTTLGPPLEALQKSLDFEAWQQDNLAVVRLSGAKRFNKTKRELVRSYNINVDKANLLFATNVNRLPVQSLLAVPCARIKQVGQCTVFDRTALEASLADVPPVLEEVVKLVYNVEFINKIPNCKCDF